MNIDRLSQFFDEDHDDTALASAPENKASLSNNEISPVVRSTSYAVDLATIPSANLGWSAQTGKTYRFVAFFSGIFLLLMLKGNHIGHIEDIYLVVFALFNFGYLIVSSSKGNPVRHRAEY